MQIIRKNFGLKLLSLCLAGVGWAYIRYAQNPIVAAARFDQQIAVPISAVNLPEGYVAHFTDKEAVVTVESKPGAAPVKPDEIKAVLDLSSRETGVYNVPVQLVAPDIAVQSLSPASVTLSVEKIDRRPFPVVVHYLGARENGIVVSNPGLRPLSVTVGGPSSLLSEVAAVRVDVPLANAPEDFDEMLRPIAVDSFGNEVSGLEVAPDLVRVEMRFVPSAGSRLQR